MSEATQADKARSSKAVNATSARRHLWADRLTGLACASPLALNPEWLLLAVRAVRDHGMARRWMALGAAYAVVLAIGTMLCARAGYPALALTCVAASSISPLYWWPLAALAERLRRLP